VDTTVSWCPLENGRRRHAMDRSSSVRLTKTIAEKAEVRDTRYDIWDLELTGFGLRVEKSGTKTFIIRLLIFAES
jgi:hypothetical protein